MSNPFTLFTCCLLLSITLSGQGQPIDLDADNVVRQIEGQLKSNGKSAATVELPWFENQRIRLLAEPATQFAPELQAKYPGIKSFRVTDAKGRYRGRLNTSAEGVFLVLVGGEQAIEIEHERVSGKVVHTLRRIDLRKEMEAFTCGVDGAVEEKEQVARPKANDCFQVGGTLRSYRLALTNTGEFAAANGGTLASVNAAFNDRIAELNAIYERELAITFRLIAGNDALVNLNAATDPFSDPNNTNVSIDQTQQYIKARIALDDYDLGHGIHVSPNNSAGGLAAVGAVCSPERKAAAYSTIFNNNALIILQHEVGHQFGCFHTNYGCENTGAQRYEPGEGVSIMGTGAGCGDEDRYARGSNLYFTVGSLQAIEDYLSTRGSCFTPLASGNQPPSSDASRAAGKTIPARTAFILEGEGSDPDGQPLTYSWEQFDTDNSNTAPPTQTAGSTTAPLFRSFEPGSVADRYLPRLRTILSGETPDGNDGEILPTVSRELNFRLTVRDNITGNACDQASIRVVDTGTPFRITSQNNSASWTADGSNTETVTWDVAGTATGEINTPNVDILLSLDGGQTFSFAVATATPNDGSHSFVVPAFATESARIMVRGSENIFLDINDGDIAISTTGPACDAAQANIAPEGAVTAAAGAEALELGLCPTFGEQLRSPITVVLDGDDVSGRTVANDGSGECISVGFQGLQEALWVTTNVTRPITFNVDRGGSQGGFTPAATLFSPAFLGDCSDYIGSTTNLIRQPNSNTFTITNNSFTATMRPNTGYDLVAFGIGAESSLRQEVEISFSGGKLFAVTEAPGEDFLYTFGVVNTATGEIVAFRDDSDLSDAGAFPPGTYQVFGLSVARSADLVSFVGGSKQALQNAIASQSICAAVSTNEVAVTILGDAAPLAETISLAGSIEGEANVLSWTSDGPVTARTLNLQRQEAATKNWTTISSATPRSKAAADRYADRDFRGNTVLYRLEVIDFGGRTGYTDVLTLERTADVDRRAFPNPIAAGDVLTLRGIDAAAGQLRLLDAAGREVFSATVVPQDGRLSVGLPANLTSGLYYLQTRSDGGVRSEVISIR